MWEPVSQLPIRSFLGSWPIQVVSIGPALVANSLCLGEASPWPDSQRTSALPSRMLDIGPEKEYVEKYGQDQCEGENKRDLEERQ